MIVAALDSTTYKLLFLLHIGSIVVAFAPAFVYTRLGQQFAQNDASSGQRLAAYVVDNSRRIHGPALILAGLFGIGMIVASDDVWEMSETWINLAFLAWFAMNGVLHALVVPAEKRKAQGDASAESRAQLGDNLMGVLFVIMLYLMIWKPGA